MSADAAESFIMILISQGSPWTSTLDVVLFLLLSGLYAGIAPLATSAQLLSLRV